MTELHTCYERENTRQNMIWNKSKAQHIIYSLVALCTTLSPSIGKAMPTQGYDVLGLAQYCDTYLKAPQLPALGTLLDTFGDPIPCIRRRIALGGLKVVQIDARDATCYRRNACEEGTPPLEDWVYLLGKARRIGVLAKKYPRIKWWISPFLEHDINGESSIRKACSVVIEGCPTCKCINSPSTGVRPAGIPVEEHGTKKRGFSVSGDGSSVFRADTLQSDGNGFAHQQSGKNQTYLWWPELNLRCGQEQQFLPPKQRTTRPTAEQFQHAWHLAQTEEPRPAPPKRCRKLRALEDGESSKPKTESRCNGEATGPRDNKPSIILRGASKPKTKLRLWSSNGQEIGCYGYGGKATGETLNRWYIGLCSGQTAMELYEVNKSEWAYVEIAKGTCIEINLLRSQRNYR